MNARLSKITDDMNNLNNDYSALERILFHEREISKNLIRERDLLKLMLGEEKSSKDLLENEKKFEIEQLIDSINHKEAELKKNMHQMSMLQEKCNSTEETYQGKLLSM